MLRSAPMSRISLLLALALALMGCNEFAKKEGIALTNDGVRALDRGDAETAYHCFRDAVEVDPNNGYAYYHLGLVEAYERQEIDAARGSFHRASELLFNNPDPCPQLGRIRYDAGAIREAKGPFQDALARNPRHASASFFLCRIADDEGDLEGANSHYRTAAESDPEDGRAFAALGSLYERVGAREEAIRVHREAIRLNPMDAHNRPLLGAILLARDDQEEAIELFLEASQLDPDNHELLFALGSGHVQAQNKENASYYLASYLARKQAGAELQNEALARVMLEHIQQGPRVVY